ncbi:DUF4113 domain-containing protein [Leeia sp.]
MASCGKDQCLSMKQAKRFPRWTTAWDELPWVK